MKPRLAVLAGCLLAGGAAIVFPGPGLKAVHADAGAPQQATYNQQIAPILYRSCASCHRPEGSAPFKLLTYEDARRWGRQIVSVTRTGYMPPWLPEADHGDFEGARRLSQQDIALLGRWVAAGMPRGSGAPPDLPVSAGPWPFGQPDLVLDAEPHPQTKDGSVVWVFRNPLKRSRAARAIVFSPGVSGAVAEARIRLTPVNGPAGGDFLFWTPNSTAMEPPEALPLRLPAGGAFTVDARLFQQGGSRPPHPRLAVYFARRAAGAARGPLAIEVSADAQLRIPAGEKNFEVERQIALPVATEIYAVYPQARGLGRSMQAYAVLPGGKREWLLSIPKWDPDQTAVYRYRRPLRLPRGTVLHVRFVYDNSTGNPRNPNDPPQAVGAGAGGEEAHLWLEARAAGGSPAAARALGKAVAAGK